MVIEYKFSFGELIEVSAITTCQGPVVCSYVALVSPGSTKDGNCSYVLLEFAKFNLVYYLIFVLLFCCFVVLLFCCRYSNGDIYSGHWVGGQRSGFGKSEETCKKGSFYIGGWRMDKKTGYGIYEDKLK